MAAPATSALTNTKAPSQTAETTPEVLQDSTNDAEMIDSAPQWLVEDDAWNYIHTEVQENAAKDEVAHEVLRRDTAPWPSPNRRLWPCYS